jgi:hypothetical protein
MTTFNYVFDATQYAPDQGMPAHPVGSKFPAYVSDTSIVPTKDNTGGMFVIEYTTQAGKINHRFNLWNQNQQAVDIAHKQLSAVSHATGVFKLDMNNAGAALRNAQLMIDVGKQKDTEYTEVKRVYDRYGNEPGKTGGGTPQPQPQAQPGPQPGPGQQWQPNAPGPQPQPQGGPAPQWGPQSQPQPQGPQGGAPGGWPGGAPQGQPQGGPAPQWGPQPGPQPGPGPAPQGGPQGGAPQAPWQQGGAPGAAPWGPR